MNYCGRNSSELISISLAAGSQSTVPGFSESRNYAAKKERNVLIFISPSESFTHSDFRAVHEP